MKNKTTTAALLSILVMAGLAVTDAYAQSNTVRLESIDEATQDILEDTEGIPGALESLAEAVSAIQTSLDSLTTSLGSMMSAITGVQDTVNGVNTKVTNMETAVYDTQSSVSSVESAVGSMSTNVDTINSKIVGVDTLLQNVADLDTRLANIEFSIMGLESTMQSMDGGDETSDTLSVLGGTVVSNAGKLTEVLQRLASIEAGLESLGADVKGISTAPSRPGNILLEGESELNVNSYDYKNYGDASTDTIGKYYELEMTFSCSTDVFVDRVFLVHDGGDALPATYHYSKPNTSANPPEGYRQYFGLDLNTGDTIRTGFDIDNDHHNFVRVDNRDLYDTQFKFTSSASTTTTYDRPAQFDNKPVKAGETIKFETQVYDRYTDVMYDKNDVPRGPLLNDDGNVASDDPIKMIAGSNRTHSLPFFEINIEWLTYESGTTCTLGFGSSGKVAPGLTKSNTLGYAVTSDPAHITKSLKSFSDTIDCGGEPVEITEISAETAEDWKPNLTGFLIVKLTYGTNEHTLAFDRDANEAVITNDDFLPIYLGNDELVISGTIPYNGLLVSLDYKSQPGTDCSTSSKYGS